MNKHFTLIFFLSFFSIYTIYCQASKLDSLETRLKNHKSNDTTKVNLWNEIAYELYSDDKPRLIKYAGFSAKLSEQLNYPKGKADSYWLMGIAAGKSNVNLAISYFTKSLNIAEPIAYKHGIAKCWNSLGVMYNFQGNNAIALSYYQKSIRLSEKINDKRTTAKFILNLCVFYSGQGEYRKAIDGYKKILKILDETDDNATRVRCLVNLASVYAFQGSYAQALDCYQNSLKIADEVGDASGSLLNYMGISGIYCTLEDYSHALEHARKALAIATQINDNRKISLCLSALGEVLFKTNNPEALDYYQRALKLFQECNDKLQSCIILINIGDYYLSINNEVLALENYENALLLAEEMGKKRLICNSKLKIGSVFLKQAKYAVALKYTQQSLALAEELKVLDVKKDIHEQLSKIYSSTEDYKNAFVHHKLYTKINTQIYNEKNTKKIAALEYAYKFDKEKQAMSIQQRKKDGIQVGIIIFLISGVVLLLLFAMFVYRSLQVKKKINLVLIDQKKEIEKVNSEYLLLNNEYLLLNQQLNQSNKQISNELELNQKSMTAATLKLIQNSERDAITIQKLQDIAQSANEEAAKSINALVADYKRASFNSNWDEFEILFEKLHSSFYEKLNTQYPTLTTNERKLCAFLKLNMNTKDIAHITFQSDEALKKARLRLRQKLSLDRKTNLTTFLQTL